MLAPTWQVWFQTKNKDAIIQMQIHISRLYTPNIGTSFLEGLFVKKVFTKKVKLERNAQTSPPPFLLLFTRLRSLMRQLVDRQCPMPKSSSFPLPGLRCVLRRRRAPIGMSTFSLPSIPTCETGYLNPNLTYLAIYIRI